MLWLEIMRGKQGMKSKQHNAELGATTGCTVRAMEAFPDAIGIKGDAYFGSVNTCKELAVRGFEGVVQVKQNTGFYPKPFIEKALKNAPGGVSIVLKGTAPNEQTLIAIGYRYSAKKTLFFCMTANAGSTKPGEPYEMKYTDSFGNVCTRKVERPDVLSKFFKDSNKLDAHNHARQDCLGLEKDWVTQDCYFRLVTTLIGINVVDTWKLAEYHHIINWSGNNPISLQHFAGILGRQLIAMAPIIARQNSRFAPSSLTLPQDFGSIVVSASDTRESFSSFSPDEEKVVIPVRTLVDCNGGQHHQVAYPITKQESGRSCTKRRACKNCASFGIRKLVRHYCITCGLSFAFCCEEDNDCFLEHVSDVKLNRPSRRSAV